MENPMQSPMQTQQTPQTQPRSTHPMILVAATSVTLVSLAGLASIAGWLPGNHGAPPPAPVAQIAQTAAPLTSIAPAAPANTEKTATLNIPSGSSITVHPGSGAVTHRTPPARKIAAEENAKVTASVPPPASTFEPIPGYGYGNRSPAPVVNYPVADNGIYAENNRQVANLCRDCGTVESVREIAQEGQGTGLGAVAGTVLGGVLGHQIGNGRGRDVATVFGALGGAYAGHEAEKNARAARQYQIIVRLDDGSTRTLTETQPPQWRSGDRVRVSNNHIAGL